VRSSEVEAFLRGADVKQSLGRIGANKKMTPRALRDQIRIFDWLLARAENGCGDVLLLVRTGNLYTHLHVFVGLQKKVHLGRLASGGGVSMFTVRMDELLFWRDGAGA
jgi:hypothetical protein